MPKIFLKYLIIFFLLVFSTSAFAYDYSKLPQIVKTNIEQYYKNQDIKVISVRKMGIKFRIIIKTESSKDKVMVDKKGKILSVSEYLKAMEATGGC
ncbi:MAG: hypothetical protein GXP61_08470 [Epsilonproteobacteria bacterium]|nr:hypothetical protein [Campylobacterota bacterium]